MGLATAILKGGECLHIYDSHYIYTRCLGGAANNMGETGQPLHCSINSHRFDITQRRTEESPVAEHFNGEGHTLANLTVMAIDQLHSHDSCLSKIRESRWIRTLGTSHPFGMNLRVDSLWNLCDDYLLTPWNSAQLIPRLRAIPRSNNYVLDIEYKYNAYNNNCMRPVQTLGLKVEV